MSEEGSSRRAFLIQSAGALAASLATSCLPDVDGEWKDQSSALCGYKEPRIQLGDPKNAGRVAEVHDPSLLDGFQVSERQSPVALKRLLLGLTGASDLRGAWKMLIPKVKPGEVVGIKINVLNDRVPTHKELVKALVDTLKRDLGVPADQILVWDRRLDELADARITTEYLGAPLEGTWDSTSGQGRGRGYELNPTCVGGQKTHLSNILTRRVDHLINFAVMKNHKASGFTGVLKNNYGVINNPGHFHDETQQGVVIKRHFESAIPGINALEEVAKKTRLWLLDATIGVAKGDTSDPADCFPAKLVAGLDPVAVDVHGRTIRDQARGKAGPSKEKTSQGWIDVAERIGLGSTSVKIVKVR